ncbi:MAG TPA: hypothetical protein VMQ48_03610, partial [Candidatus Saccharimonadales bacterium]|nr:hypothetical protein [Candidatus Saccharimonadales bacterium]
MKEKKDKQKIGDIFFGKAGEVFTNVRLFLRFKKIVKIIGKERKAVEGVRGKIAKLYGTTNNSTTENIKVETRQCLVSTEAKKEKNKKADLVFVPLSEIAKNSTYSKNYINFSARQGKLKAKKIKGVWHTTEEWLAEFTEKSQAKKNQFKEKLSKDHGGDKKFVEVAEKAEIGSLASTMEAKLPKQVVKEERIGSFPLLKAELEREMLEKKKAKDNLKKAVAPRAIILRARKSFAKSWNSAKTWVRELGEMEGARQSAKLKKAKLADFWKLDYAKPAAAIIALILLMAIGNITKADLASMGDRGKKQIYFTYNAGVDTVAKIADSVNKGAGKSIAKVKIGKESFVKIAEDVLRREKIIDFEKKTGIALKGNEESKGNLVNQEQGGAVLGEESGRDAINRVSTTGGAGEGVVLAAATGAAQTNIGDIEVSAYLMDGANKELPNGEYDVRFGIYTTDRTEADPYPSDTDKGTRVWEETQTVTVENGLLKTYLGATTPIPASFNFAASNYYIGIRVGEDGEMVPRKRIGAVPLARTAMNATTVNGLTVGNAAGNVPTSNGTLNTNLNADLLDGLHSTAFQVAGSYQPAGTYDNYVAWKLQAFTADAGQKITMNKGAIFTGANGIVTTRTLNTLTIAPTYGSTDNTIAQGSTVITVNTDGNLQGGGSGTAGGGISLTLNTVDNPTFTTAYVSTLDLGTNTITDQNLNGDWNFNAGVLSNIASATVTGNFNLTASSNLIFGGTTSLAATTAPNNSGAYLVGVNDEFANSNSTNVQAVLKDLDAAIAGGGGPGTVWTLSAGNIHPTDNTNSLAVGTASQFQVSNTGNVTGGTYNGVTLSGNGTLATGTGPYTLTLTGSSNLNQNLLTTSSPTFN